jgi:geranylgeranyl pyrophosphate synthase
MAFQVVDDVLDFVGDQTTLGKPVAATCARGWSPCATLCYLEQHPDDPLIVRILKSGRGNDEDIGQAVRAIRESGAIDSALAEARDLAHRSLQALERLPAGPPRRAMEDLTDFVVQRRT